MDIGASAGIGFVLRSLTTANPVVDLTALKNRNFALGCFFSFITGVGIFGTIYLTPLFLGRVRGFSALQIGARRFHHWLVSDFRDPFLRLLRAGGSTCAGC